MKARITLQVALGMDMLVQSFHLRPLHVFNLLTGTQLDHAQATGYAAGTGR